MTHEELEKWVRCLLIINAHNEYEPLTEKECAYIEDIRRRVVYRGYRIASDAVNIAEVKQKYEDLMQQIKVLEEEYPELKEKNSG